MMAKVLVTGGAGFIGCPLVSRLIDGGSEIVVADVIHPQVHRGVPASLPSKATLIPFDVTHRPPWDALLQMSGRTRSCIWLPRRAQGSPSSKPADTQQQTCSVQRRCLTP